jgi:uncharacterized protein (TIGR00252 family)
MTAKEVFELRKQGCMDEAYEAARSLYAVDKSPYASSAMFWTAVDKLKALVGEGRLDEAEKIRLALERLLPTVPDEEGWVSDAFRKCRELLEKGEMRQHLQQEGPANFQTGVWGEGVAAAYLREKGYVILERDWHSGHRDIDIIAQKDDTIVFVEVKARRTSDFGSPELAVDYKKQQHLLRAINHYVSYRRLEFPWRFDVISIVGMPGQQPEIKHIEDFQLNQRW